MCNCEHGVNIKTMDNIILRILHVFLRHCIAIFRIRFLGVSVASTFLDEIPSGIDREGVTGLTRREI
jgi:hypothetical protein